MEKEEQKKASVTASDTSSSHIGGLLDKITGPLTVTDSDGVASTSEIAHKLSQLDREDRLQEFHGTAEYEVLRAGEEQDRFEMGVRQARIEDDLRRRENSQATHRVESGWLPSDLGDMRAYSDLTGKTEITGVTRRRSSSVGSIDSSRLSSPPPTTILNKSTVYEGSILAIPPSALPMDPFSTPRASAGIIAQRYIQSEENASQHAEKDNQEGMDETRKVYTPIPRKFDISDSSVIEEDMMTEVEWWDEDPYMMPTKKGKKRNKGKGVKRPVTPERPIPNMPQTPSRRKLEADWPKPAESLTNQEGPVNLEAFIGEYLRNTDGLRDFMVGREDYDVKYAKWCGEQAEHVAARRNHTDMAVMDAQKISMEIKKQVELSRERDEARMEKLDERLSKIERRLAKVVPVNMAKTIENAMSNCMERMVDQLTDRVVGRFENMAEDSRKKNEIRRGKQVEATPEEEDMSDIEFEPGATFSEEENAKVERVIRAEMEVDEQVLEQSKHALVIPPGGVSKEFPRLRVGQVTVLKKKPVVPAVPQQKKKEVKKPEEGVIPKGPKAGGKKPEV